MHRKQAQPEWQAEGRQVEEEPKRRRKAVPRRKQNPTRIEPKAVGTRRRSHKNLANAKVGPKIHKITAGQRVGHRPKKHRGQGSGDGPGSNHTTRARSQVKESDSPEGNQGRSERSRSGEPEEIRPGNNADQIQTRRPRADTKGRPSRGARAENQGSTEKSARRHVQKSMERRARARREAKRDRASQGGAAGRGQREGTRAKSRVPLGAKRRSRQREVKSDQTTGRVQQRKPSPHQTCGARKSRTSTTTSQAPRKTAKEARPGS